MLLFKYRNNNLPLMLWLNSACSDNHLFWQCVFAASHLQGQRFIIVGEWMLKHHSSQQLRWLRVTSHILLKLLFCLEATHWKRHVHAKTNIRSVAVWYSLHVGLFSSLSHGLTLALANLTEYGPDAVSILNTKVNIIIQEVIYERKRYTCHGKLKSKKGRTEP